MAVKLVEEIPEATSEHVRLVLKSIEGHQPPPAEGEAPRPVRPPTKDDLIEAMGTLARILGFRMQLFAAFLGAAGLHGFAMHDGGVMPLVTATIYDLLVFVPLLAVAFKRG